MKKNNVVPGLILILIAAIMMASAMGFMPDIPWFRIACGILLGSWTVRALMDRDFFGTLMSASIIAWIFEEELRIEHLAPFPLIAAAALLGIGLNMIFGKKQKVVHIPYTDGEQWREGSFDDVKTEDWIDGRHISFENNFNSTSKYVNSSAFSSAKLENNFGSANIYFNNATIANDEAVINLDNNFGKMNVYFPGKWRASITQNSSFGHVGVFGEPNRDMDAPHVIIKAESNFGDLSIFFD